MLLSTTIVFKVVYIATFLGKWHLSFHAILCAVEVIMLEKYARVLGPVI